MNVPEHIEEGAPAGWRYYLKAGIRGRWWLMISAVLFWAAALTLSLVLPAKYKSETLVLVEQDAIPAQYVTPNVSVGLQQRLQTMTEQTLSRARLVQIIGEFHLYGSAPGQSVAETIVKRMRDDISVELIRSNDRGEISAFKIIYSGPTPELAQKVTARLASLFINDSLASQQRLSENTTSFLGSQLDEARKDLDRQESRLREFRSKNLGELPEQMQSNMQILSGLQGRLQAATESLHQAEQQRLYLGSLIGWSNNEANAAGRDSAAGTSTPLDDQIAKMKSDLANLSARYTPRHPDVIHLKEEIASAEKVKRQTEGSAHSTPGKHPAGAADIQARPNALSPVAQLQSQFKANELEIKNRKEEIKDLEAQIGQYQARLNLTPIKEQQLAEVTRNHDQSRSYYESLLAKKLQSEMANELSKQQQNGRFRMIDPPSLPQHPYWPNRLKFSAIGLFAGLMIGLVAISVKETIDAKIHSEDDLTNWAATLPVLATVPPLTTPAERKQQTWRRGIEIAIASLLVALVPAITIVVYLKG